MKQRQETGLSEGWLCWLNLVMMDGWMDDLKEARMRGEGLQ